MSKRPPEVAATSARINPALMIFITLPLLGLLAAAFVILSSASNAGSVSPIPLAVSLPSDADMINAPMIDFTLNTLTGTPVSLSDFAGRVVFLNFWATWCGPCEREIPALQEFTRQQAALPEGAIVLAVNMQENPEEVRNFLDARRVRSLLVLMDSEGTAADSYGVIQLPVTFVIDREGVVRYPKFGEVTVEELNAYVAALNPAVPPPEGTS